MTKTAEMIIEEDIRKVYLGNLNTVEFDLKLPLVGENGSKITWVSDNELFLRPDGSVTRPWNGIGDRKVHLHACFEYGGLSKEKIYEVHILEEPRKEKIVEALPLKRTVRKDKLALLPGAVVLRADNGHFFSRQVTWEGGNEQVFGQCGNFCLTGTVKDEPILAKLEVEVREDFETEKMDTAPLAHPMDSGETALLPNSVFYRAMENAVAYFQNIDDDQMLYNFRKAAGLDTLGAPQMAGWDSPECLLRGHTTGHYLSALALCYRETKNEEIYRKLCYLVMELAKCQEMFSKKEGFQEGYIGGYSEEQFDLLEQGERYPNIWAPYYTLHKLLAGLLDAYCQAEVKEALEVAKKAGMWVYRRLSRLNKVQCEKMWDTYIAGEYGGMNESFAKLYELTGEKVFLVTAKMFDNDRLFVPMQEKYDVLEGMHANQHIPQIVGCMEMFRATGEKQYYDTAAYFWEAVTDSHIFANGGTGDNEMFFEPDNAAGHLTTETAEFCASYNMLKLTKELFKYHPDVRYMDYYERAMFNHIVAGGDKEPTGDITYFYPLAPGSRKDPKFVNACCHGTGMESQMKYSESIYFHTADTLYVNLFLNAETTWEEKGVKVIQQLEENPGGIHLHFAGEGEFLLKIRCPYWCDGQYSVVENGRNALAKCGADGYINIQRTRATEDIHIRFHCRLRIETTADSPDTAVLAYGPYILAALSDQETFLKFKIQEMEPEKEMKAALIDRERLAFQTEEGGRLTWVPLPEIGNEKHHVYWKMK